MKPQANTNQVEHTNKKKLINKNLIIKATLY